MAEASFRRFVEDYINPDSDAKVKFSSSRHIVRLVLLGRYGKQLEAGMGSRIIPGGEVAVVMVDRIGERIPKTSEMEDPDSALFAIRRSEGITRIDKVVIGSGACVVSEFGVHVEMPDGPKIFMPNNPGMDPKYGVADIIALEDRSPQLAGENPLALPAAELRGGTIALAPSERNLVNA